jgi:hypothetical protein
MVIVLALALLLKGPAEPRLTVHLSIDQDGGLSALQLQLAIDEVRKIWSEAGVVVTSGRYDEPASGIARAAISLRILRTRLPVEDGAEQILAWVAAADLGRTAPLLFVSLPAVTETVQGASAFELPVAKLTLGLRDRLIARALGRVAAHELGHYLLQHAGHQPHGLMRPRYSPNELVGDWLEPFKVPRAEQMVVRQEIRAMARYQAAGQQ